ncbi:MAG: hypothetical protein EHM72_05080 [Calditrichaeota bacterium]|nr:MAG: hypothetical protein EHM72_05080 [Calditrichota bacterium]
MNSREVKQFVLVFVLTIALLSLIFSGCSKDTSTSPTPSTSITANTDVAESVADAVGEQSGGVVDQMGDVFMLAKSIQLEKTTDDGFLDHREAIYDETTGTWTIVLQRERGVHGKAAYGYWNRTFTCQFLNIDGLPQKYYITHGDTARTINFNILAGDGYHKNVRLSHDLKELQGSFIATNVHTDWVTINGTYRRAAVDTLTTQNFTRISDHVLQLTITDLVGPRGSRNDLSQKISGTITGTFHAEIVFDGRRGYAESTVDKTINIVIDNGEAEIAFDGQRFMSNVQTGQIK